MKKNEMRLVSFLADYTATLLECGATATRVEKNVCRMAQAYGCDAEIIIDPHHVEIVLHHMQGYCTERKGKLIRPGKVDYHVISELSRLSWICYDRHLARDEAFERFRKIKSAAPIPFPIVLVLTSLANASFCRLFGGDAVSMVILFVATACGFLLKQSLIERWRVDSRAAIISGACVSAVISCSGYVFALGSTPDIALATSVLYLVPGIHYLNAMSDLIDGKYLLAASRLIYAGILTVCLAVGLYFGLWMMHAQTTN